MCVEMYFRYISLGLQRSCGASMQCHRILWHQSFAHISTPVSAWPVRLREVLQRSCGASMQCHRILWHQSFPHGAAHRHPCKCVDREIEGGGAALMRCIYAVFDIGYGARPFFSGKSVLKDASRFVASGATTKVQKHNFLKIHCMQCYYNTNN